MSYKKMLRAAMQVIDAQDNALRMAGMTHLRVKGPKGHALGTLREMNGVPGPGIQLGADAPCMQMAESEAGGVLFRICRQKGESDADLVQRSVDEFRASLLAFYGMDDASAAAPVHVVTDVAMDGLDLVKTTQELRGARLGEKTRETILAGQTCDIETSSPVPEHRNDAEIADDELSASEFAADRRAAAELS